MKVPYKLAVLLFATSLVVVSCDKEEDEIVPTPPSQTDLLTANSWTLVDIKIQPLQISIWDSVPACEKDDVIKFNIGGIGDWDNGTDWCDEDSVQMENFAWGWSNATQTEITIPDDSSDTVLKDIQLTATTMSANNTITENNGDVITLLMKFEKAN